MSNGRAFTNALPCCYETDSPPAMHAGQHITTLERLNELAIDERDSLDAEVRALESQNQALQERAEKAEGWLRFIADTQHRLLDAFKIELSDEEWHAFADALGALSPTQETDPE